MSLVGQTRSFGDVGLMSGLPESGHGWAIYEYAPGDRVDRGRRGLTSPGSVVGARSIDRSRST